MNVEEANEESSFNEKKQFNKTVVNIPRKDSDSLGDKEALP